MKETWRNCEKSFVIFFFTPLSRLPNAHRFRACILISSTSNVNRVSSIFIRRISILKSMGWDDFIKSVFRNRSLSNPKPVDSRLWLRYANASIFFISNEAKTIQTRSFLFFVFFHFEFHDCTNVLS